MVGTVSTSEESERRLAEAMRAQAGRSGRGAGRPPAATRARPAAAPGRPAPAPVGSPGSPRRSGAPRLGPAGPTPRASTRSHRLWAAAFLDARLRVALLIGLLGGVVLGVALALLSLLAPGVLPALG